MKYEEMGKARKELYQAMLDAGSTKQQAESNAVDYVLSLIASQNGIGEAIETYRETINAYRKAVQEYQSARILYDRKKNELEKARSFYEEKIKDIKAEFEDEMNEIEDKKNEFEVEKEEFFEAITDFESAEYRDRLRLMLLYKQTVERPTDPYAKAFYNQSIGAILAGGPLPNIKKIKGD